MFGAWFGLSAEEMAAMSNGTYVAPATKEAKEKAEQVAADAKKSDEEKLEDGFRSCREAGKKLPKRLLGIVDRETGKLTDQFTILEDHAEKVSEIVMEEFLNQLDIELGERGLLDDE
jgi:hypothetical protein